MAEFKATASQKAAIEARDRAVLISAGAGSGKTRVLTERLLGFLTAPGSTVNVDDFIIISFTRASAAELRGRILQAISKAVELDPDNAHLRRQTALCSCAKISTIDSFCTTLLRENTALLQTLPPDFQIIDEQRAALMKREVMDSVLTACYTDTDALPGFCELVESFGSGHDDAELGELVLDLYTKMQSHPYPERWAESVLRQLCPAEGDAGATLWGEYLLSRDKAALRYHIRALEAVCADMEEDAQLQKLKANLEECRDIAARLLATDGWDSLCAALQEGLPRSPAVRNPENPELKERAAATKTAFSKYLKTLSGGRYSLSSAETLRLTREAAAPMAALLELTDRFSKGFAAAKLRYGLADFNDLSHEVIRVLTNPDGTRTPFAEEFSRRYTEVMVDEVQDINEVQATIFEAICKNPGGKNCNLFYVGDIKQAIYRFRLADPEIFKRKLLSYAPAETAAPGEAIRIEMQENFRSRKEIINAVNAVFSRCMSDELGDCPYDDKAELCYGSGAYEGSVPVPELLLLARPAEKLCAEQDSALTREAKLVAGKIRTLLQEGTTVNGEDGVRPLRYSDIAVLLRSANKDGPEFKKALEACGVPVSAEQPGGFFSSDEISLVVSLLHLLDYPGQDIPLLSVLGSPLFRFSADTLAEIRLFNKRTGFYNALRLAAAELPEVQRFLETLEHLRAMAPDLRMGELLWEIYHRLDLLALCSAMPEGEKRAANLMRLIDLAQSFEGTGYHGLHRFVLWLDSSAANDNIIVTGVSAPDAVTIISVHKSKGLEYPVVFLSTAGKSFNKRDSSAPVLVHKRLGLGPSMLDLTRRLRYPTQARDAIQLALTREERSEQLRLLYVAMTRAKERLFITASARNPMTTYEKLCALLSGQTEVAPEELMKKDTYLGWLLYALILDGQQHLKLRFYDENGMPVNEAGAVLAQGEPEAPAPDLPAGSGPELLRRLEENLSYRYPCAGAVGLPSKITATELKHAEEPNGDSAPLLRKRAVRFRHPQLHTGESALRGAARGTATHLVLQYIDFSAVASREAVEAELKRLTEQRFIAPEQAAAVDPEAVLSLFASPIGQRLLAAYREGTLRREFKFSLLVPARELLPSVEEVNALPPEEKILLQGVVDCYTEEADGLVVVDYKTDKLPDSAALETKTAYYAGQLSAYATALQRITGKPVREAWLYFLDKGIPVRAL